MNIADILRHKNPGGDAAPVVTIAPDDTVPNMLAALAEHNVGALPVLDSGGLVGIASERDVVRGLAARGAGVLDATVRELMTTDLVTCAPTDSVDSIAETMTQRRIRHMPVLDGERLVGIVSIGDVVSSRIRQLESDRGQLEQYISG